MLNFEPIELRHRPLLASYAGCFHERTTEGSFATLYIWSHKYKVHLCENDGVLYLRSEAGEYPSYLLPRCDGDLAQSLMRIEGEADKHGYPFAIRGLSEPMTKRVEQSLPGRYTFTPHPETADYLYLASDLRDLPGKRYHGKRNFIARFESTYAGLWSYEEISAENLGDAFAFQARWCRKNNCSSNLSLQEESTAISTLLANMDSLGAAGGLLRVDGRAVAFTIGSPCSPDTIDIHVEKADYDFVGSYPMINRAFLRNAGAWATYVNREEDLGLEGLRRAKRSYHPTALLMRYTALRREVGPS